MKTTLHSHT